MFIEREMTNSHSLHFNSTVGSYDYKSPPPKFQVLKSDFNLKKLLSPLISIYPHVKEFINVATTEHIVEFTEKLQ